MKNLVILFVVFFSLFLTSCSDVLDNSMVTNPVMEKTLCSGSTLTASPVYPYPYLFNFAEIKGIKYFTPEGTNSVQFLMPDFEINTNQLFVVVSFQQDISSKTFFIDEIDQNNFKIDGLDASGISDVKVYYYSTHSWTENVSPFSNNTLFNESAVSAWKLDGGSIVVEAAQWPSSLKYLFAEIQTKAGNYFVFLQRPYSNSFRIPEYGKYGVESIKLFGHHTIMESALVTE